MNRDASRYKGETVLFARKLLHSKVVLVYKKYFGV